MQNSINLSWETLYEGTFACRLQIVATHERLICNNCLNLNSKIRLSIHKYYKSKTQWLYKWNVNILAAKTTLKWFRFCIPWEICVFIYLISMSPLESPERYVQCWRHVSVILKPFFSSLSVQTIRMKHFQTIIYKRP